VELCACLVGNMIVSGMGCLLSS